MQPLEIFPLHALLVSISKQFSSVWLLLADQGSCDAKDFYHHVISPIPWFACSISRIENNRRRLRHNDDLVVYSCTNGNLNKMQLDDDEKVVEKNAICSSFKYLHAGRSSIHRLSLWAAGNSSRLKIKWFDVTGMWRRERQPKNLTQLVCDCRMNGLSWWAASREEFNVCTAAYTYMSISFVGIVIVMLW